MIFLPVKYVLFCVWIALVSVIVLRMQGVEIDVTGELSAPVVLEKLTGTKSSFKQYITLPSVSSWVKSSLNSIQPWSVFANTTNIRAPQSFPRLIKRAVNNLKHFQGNYVIIALLLMAYTLLTSPLLTLSIFAALIACYIISLRQAERKLMIAGKEVSLQQQYGLVGLCFLPVCYWAGVGQAVFWVMGASCFVISLHAGLYNIEAILPDQEQLEVILDQI